MCWDNCHTKHTWLPQTSVSLLCCLTVAQSTPGYHKSLFPCVVKLLHKAHQVTTKTCFLGLLPEPCCAGITVTQSTPGYRTHPFTWTSARTLLCCLTVTQSTPDYHKHQFPWFLPGPCCVNCHTKHTLIPQTPVSLAGLCLGG